LDNIFSSPWGAGISILIVVAVIYIVIVKFIALVVILGTRRQKEQPGSSQISREEVDGESGKEDNFSSIEGAVGVAATALRPYGFALINGKRLEVKSRGSILEKDTPIRVTKIKGKTIFVEDIGGMW